MADWIKCRILTVDRTVRKEGGYAVYDETVMQFSIEDTSYTVY